MQVWEELAVEGTAVQSDGGQSGWSRVVMGHQDVWSERNRARHVRPGRGGHFGLNLEWDGSHSGG